MSVKISVQQKAETETQVYVYIQNTNRKKKNERWNIYLNKIEILSHNSLKISIVDPSDFS